MSCCFLAVLGSKNTIHIVCVPGQAGVDRNQKADELSNIAYDTDFISPKPTIGIPYSFLFNKIEKLYLNTHLIYWFNSPGFQHTRKIGIFENTKQNNYGFTTGLN